MDLRHIDELVAHFPDGANSERETWQYLHDPLKGAYRRELALLFFKQLMELYGGRLHPDFLRLTADDLDAGKTLKGGALEFMHGMSSDALRLLADCGTHYKSSIFWKAPGREPKPRRCYEISIGESLAHYHTHRARAKSDADRDDPDNACLYVEGIALGSFCWPMSHAWNTYGFRLRHAYDVSWYATAPWTHYFGIALTAPELAWATRIAGDYEGIFLRNHYHAEVGRYITARLNMTAPERMELEMPPL